MTSQNYQALRLQTAGNEAIPKILQLLRDSKLSDLCYAYKIRAKPEKKLIEKVVRKKESNADYSLDKITDIVGLRLVALFRAEMVDIFEGVLTAITHSNGINPNPFVKGPPDEVIIYLGGSNAYDDLPGRLKEIAGRICPTIHLEEKNSNEGYSSIHLVARLEVHVDDIWQNYKIPIEIQIRSVFEDAWGEIDHKFGYVTRSGKDTGKPINNPEFVLAHLKVLKRFADACMEYADAIRIEAIGEPTSLTPIRKVISVASDNNIIERFKVLNVSGDVIDEYCKIRDIKSEAEKLVDKDRNKSKMLYMSAAESYRNLALIAESFKGSEGGKLIYYYTRMNEAICLMAINERDQVIAAFGIYQSLESIYSDFPLLKMRLGQALGKLGHLDDAIIRLREAGESAQIIALDYQSKENFEWPDFLPYTDYEHIVLRQPKLLGYHIWLKIRTLGLQQEDEKILLFKEAYQVTKNGLEALKHDPEQELSLQNNLLYYALGCLTRCRDSVDQALFKQCVQEHLNYVENHVKSETEVAVTHADTLMKAYSALGLTDKAKNMAEVVMDKCLEQDTPDLDPKEKNYLARIARQIVKGQNVSQVD